MKGEQTWTSSYSLLQPCCPSAFLPSSMVRHLLCFCFIARLAHLFVGTCHTQRLMSPQGIFPLALLLFQNSSAYDVTGRTCIQGTPRKSIFTTGLWQIPLQHPQCSQKITTVYYFKQKDLQYFTFRSTKWSHTGFAWLNVLGFFWDQSLNNCKENMAFLLSCYKCAGKKKLSVFPHMLSFSSLKRSYCL